jgi:DNA-binding transcriptional MerR regulator
MDTPSTALRLGLTQREAAALLQISTRSLRRWARQGFGPQPVRDGGQLLYDRAAILAFAEGAAQ